MWKKFIERCKQVKVLITTYRMVLSILAILSIAGYGAATYEPIDVMEPEECCLVDYNTDLQDYIEEHQRQHFNHILCLLLLKVVLHSLISTCLPRYFSGNIISCTNF